MRQQHKKAVKAAPAKTESATKATIVATEAGAPESVVAAVAEVPAPSVRAAAESAATAAAVAKVRPASRVAKAKAAVARRKASLPASGKEPAGEPAKSKDEKAAALATKLLKPRKLKLVRDSYAMPEAEYAQIGMLKKRLLALGADVKKSELLRGGVAALVALGDSELKVLMAGVERIKTGRPSKK